MLINTIPIRIINTSMCCLRIYGINIAHHTAHHKIILDHKYLCDVIRSDFKLMMRMSLPKYTYDSCALLEIAWLLCATDIADCVKA